MRGLKVLGVTDERSVLFLEEAFGKGHFSYATSPGAVQTVVQMNTITHGGNDIAVVQIPRRGSIETQIWPVSCILMDFLVTLPLISHSDVLELGSGCGMVGLVAAAAGAKHVVLTDTEEAIDHLQMNAVANVQLGHVPDNVVDVQALEWGSDGSFSRGQFSLILVSDCVYMPHLFSKLANTLRLLADKNTSILLAHQWRNREAEQAFFQEISTIFEVSELSCAHACEGEFLLANIQLKKTTQLHSIVNSCAMESGGPLPEELDHEEGDMGAMGDFFSLIDT